MFLKKFQVESSAKPPQWCNPKTVETCTTSLWTMTKILLSQAETCLRSAAEARQLTKWVMMILLLLVGPKSINKKYWRLRGNCWILHLCWVSLTRIPRSWGKFNNKKIIFVARWTIFRIPKTHNATIKLLLISSIILPIQSKSIKISSQKQTNKFNKHTAVAPLCMKLFNLGFPVCQWVSGIFQGLKTFKKLLIRLKKLACPRKAGEVCL